MDDSRSNCNPFFNFLKLFRRHRRSWSNVKLAVEAARRWQQMPAAERRTYGLIKPPARAAIKPASRRRHRKTTTPKKEPELSNQQSAPEKPLKGVLKNANKKYIKKRQTLRIRDAKQSAESDTSCDEAPDKPRPKSRKTKPKPENLLIPKAPTPCDEEGHADDEYNSNSSEFDENKLSSEDFDEEDPHEESSESNDGIVRIASVPVAEGAKPMKRGTKRTWRMMMDDFLRSAEKPRANPGRGLTVIPYEREYLNAKRQRCGAINSANTHSLTVLRPSSVMRPSSAHDFSTRGRLARRRAAAVRKNVQRHALQSPMTPQSFRNTEEIYPSSPFSEYY